VLVVSFTVPRDLEFTADRRDLLLIQGGEEIRQKADNALQVFQGDWIFDARAGLRHKDLLFGRSDLAIALWRAEVVRVVESVGGVLRATEVRADYDRTTRRLTVTWAAQTVAGPVRSEVTFG
jgi:hypothetical protein